MKDLAQVLYDRLSVVATRANGRIYDDHAPEGAEYPLIVMHEVGGKSVQRMNGSAGFGTVAVQFNCFVDDMDTKVLRELAEQVRLAFIEFSEEPYVMSSLHTLGPLSLQDTEGKKLGKAHEFRFLVREPKPTQ